MAHTQLCLKHTRVTNLGVRCPECAQEPETVAAALKGLDDTAASIDKIWLNLPERGSNVTTPAVRAAIEMERHMASLAAQILTAKALYLTEIRARAIDEITETWTDAELGAAYDKTLGIVYLRREG